MLILGGSSEATALATALAARSDVRACLSLAGRTAAPASQPVPVRVGGFGGVAGLVDHLHANDVEILVDATHPFAAQMSRHAAVAAREADCRFIRVSRPAWRPQPGDRWTSVATMGEAAVALGATPRRVFLTVGRLQLDAFAVAPQHHYLVRTIDPLDADPGLPSLRVIRDRGPFTVEAEERLMRREGIDVLVTKNSGGAAAAAKLVAARRLGLPVVLVARPEPPGPELDVAGALALIADHRASARRGV